MPGGFLSADLGFPRFAEGESAASRMKKIESYLYQLLEALRYTLSNLGEENVNGTEWNKITNSAVFTALGEAGATVINGGNITTGTIDASKAEIKNIDAREITVGELNGVNIRGVKIYGVDVYGSQYHGGTGNSALFYIDARATGACLIFKNSETNTELFSIRQDANGDTTFTDLYLLGKLILSRNSRDANGVVAAGSWEFVNDITLPAGSAYPTRAEVQSMIAAALANYYTKSEADARFAPLASGGTT